MKKLMITLSAAALATSVFADEGTPTMYQETEGFETYAAETVITNATAVDGGSTMLWYSASVDETGTVKAYAEADETRGEKYLNVETTTGTPLYRKLVAHNAGDLVNQDSHRVDIGDGIYVDTYVQFTASEEAPTEIADSKLVVWVKETVDEATGTSTKDLMVMAGQLNASGVPTATNFVINTTDMNLTGWHRLTIRAMVARDDAQNSIAAFTLFLDGVQLAAKAIQVPGTPAVYEEDGETIKEEAVADVTYETLMGAYAYANLSAEAQKFYRNKQLFYSLVGTDQSGIVKKISAVGFDGSGQIDNVTVTTTARAPQFAKGAYYFTITWEEGVKSFELLGDGVSLTNHVVTATSDSVEFEIPNTVTTLKIANIVPTEGATIVEAVHEYNLAVVKAATIEADATQFVVDGVGCSSFAEALKAARTASDNTISLYKDVTLADIQEIAEGYTIVLDLNGKTLTSTIAEGHLFEINGGSLTIISSASQGAMIDAVGDSDDFKQLVMLNSGNLTIGNTTTDAGVKFDGEVYYDDLDMSDQQLFVYKGLFDDASNGGEDEETSEKYFYLAEMVVDADCAMEGEYWVVTPSAGGEDPEPDTEIEVGSESVEYTEEQDAIDAAKKIETITVPEEDKETVDSGWFKAAVVKKVKEGGSFVWVVKPILDKNAAGVIKDVVPTVEAAVKEILESADNDIFQADDNGDITINLTELVQGLTYGVEVVTDLKNLGTGEPTWGGKVDATKTTAIKVKKPAGGKAFFKIHVDYK